MTIKKLETDLEDHTIEIEAEYEATTGQIWNLWADPRLLERWWGPPGYPATVTDHDFTAGGLVRYYMTGPEGEKYHGGWRVQSVDTTKQIVLEDFFADEDGEENAAMPVSTTTVSISDGEGGTTRMSMLTRYQSRDGLEKVLEMGMEEGIRSALGQIPGILNEIK